MNQYGFAHLSASDLLHEEVIILVSVRLVGDGLAGVTAVSVTYPLDVVRTRLATQVMPVMFHV